MLAKSAYRGPIQLMSNRGAAVLQNVKAIGDQLTCVFVDTGLLRKGEAEQVEDTFRRQFHVDLEDDIVAACLMTQGGEVKRK